MHQVLGVLLAAAFNVQQILAGGVIAGGAALTIGAASLLFQKPKPPAAGQPVPKKVNPLIAVLLSLVGLALVFAGVSWRLTASQPTGR